MLSRKDLWSLEQYAEKRETFRAEVLAYKKTRRVLVGQNILLVFENQKTIKYQVQEMLRIEKIFEATGIEEELEAYNPLIPDGNNWKCSMLIQYAEVHERKKKAFSPRTLVPKLPPLELLVCKEGNRSSACLVDR